MTDYRDGVYLMNPGAVAEGCYGMVDITPRRHYAAALPVINTIFKEKRQNL